ncbi:MAG: endonuclease/exonuclease/phosphatase family protein [Parcubacteria group bacterium Gr01-1014_29]|nr:MAG: endonuclease/exonuclease/phosphatase family protein [Parcubacteria group bacterium Gr01-1014_29]
MKGPSSQSVDTKSVPTHSLYGHIFIVGKKHVHPLAAWLAIGVVSLFTFTLIIEYGRSQIASGAYIEVISPNGDEYWVRQSPQVVTWNSSGATNVRIDLLRGSNVSSNIVNSVSALAGSYTWNVPKGQVVDSNYSVRITSTAGGVSDSSNATFSIVETLPDELPPSPLPSPDPLLQAPANVIYASKDATLKKPHPNSNTGIAKLMLIKKGGGINRGIVGFSLADMPGADTINKVTLRMYVSSVANIGTGKYVGVYRILEDWTEGNGDFDASIAGTGTGVTWICAIDLDLADGRTNCGNPWNGGKYVSAPTDVFLQISAPTATWNVTSDILNALQSGDTEVSWLITKTPETQDGSARYHTRDGAIYYNNMDFMPQLIIETN